jgi:hypothetical protein
MNTMTTTMTTNTNTQAQSFHISMNALKRLAVVNPKKVAEFARHIGRFHGLVAQLENAKITGTCYTGPNPSGTASVMYWVDWEGLSRKVRMAENVAVSNVRHLNEIAANNGLDALLNTSKMTNTQIAACVLHFVEKLVRRSEYKDYMAFLKL